MCPEALSYCFAHPLGARAGAGWSPAAARTGCGLYLRRVRLAWVQVFRCDRAPPGGAERELPLRRAGRGRERRGGNRTAGNFIF